MAKGKGKSQRRPGGLEHRYRTGDDVEEVSVHGRKLSRRGVKLHESAFAAEGLEDLPRREGLIVGVFRRGALVRVGAEELFCGIAKTFRAPEGSSPLAVGDVADITAGRPGHTDGQTDIDKDRVDGMILSRRPRETALVRPQPRSGKRRSEHQQEVFEKVIAANMDLLLIVASTGHPPLRHGLIDRFLISADRGELEPVLVVNKIDLGPPDDAVLADFRSLDVRVLLCSAKSGAGLDELRPVLQGKRSVLAGASGVGKSALINSLVPGAEAVTRTVRRKDSRGRHTTSAATVYDLPGGGFIVDTPGIRELGVRVERAELSWYFPEFDALCPKCKFNDCTHTHEPGCAVVAAVERGEIKSRRYDGYLRILETLRDS